MTIASPESSDLFDCVQDFVNVTQFGEVTLVQLTKFEHLLRENKEARHLYTELIKMSVHLPRALTGLGIRNDDGNQGIENAGDSNSVQHSSCSDQPPSSVPRFPFLSTAYHGTIGFLSQELPFSLLIATLLTGFGLWFASLVYVSGPEKIAKDSSPGQSSFDPTLKIVGKITGMVDCKWSKDCRVRSGDDTVLVGRQFKLESGLMEITYDTGAKAILQGPVTYKVESNGGYLTVGKLTGKLENKAEAASLISPFSIRTPTVTVTDLGTEFGVEVDRRGNVTCAVLSGEVQFSRVTGADAGDKEPVSVRVKQGQAVQAKRQESGIFRSSFNPTSFVRTIGNRAVASKSSKVLISMSNVKPSWWRYSTERPKGDYTQPNFDDSYWAMSKAGFGSGIFHSGPGGSGTRLSSPPIVTIWTSPEIWLRQELVVTDPIDFHKAMLTLFNYGSVEVHVNGKLICRRSEVPSIYTAFDVTDPLRAAIKQGVNVVAVHADRIAKGGQYIDLGLVLDPMDDHTPNMPLSPQQLRGKPLTLVTTVDESPATWRWTTDRPSRNWANLHFDHGGWREGKAGFGGDLTNNTGEMYSTPWNSDDIWLRKDIEIDKLPARYLGVLKIYHDEDAEVFVNGKLVFNEAGHLTGMKAVDITERLRGVLRPGRNVLAVHVHQTIGGQYIDTGLTIYPTEEK